MSPFFHESILLNDKAILSSWDLHYAVIVKNCYELVSLPPVLFFSRISQGTGHDKSKIETNKSIWYTDPTVTDNYPSIQLCRLLSLPGSLRALSSGTSGFSQSYQRCFARVRWRLSSTHAGVAKTSWRGLCVRCITLMLRKDLQNTKNVQRLL